MRRPTQSDKTASGKAAVAGTTVGGPQEVLSVLSTDDQNGSSGCPEFTGSGAAEPASQACSSVTGESIPLPKRATFPVKLHAILSRPDLSSAISWCNDGTAFRVQQPKEFAGNVLPCYFDHNNFSSFLRKVRGWGFKRIRSGPYAGAYYHNLFHRDEPYLALRMKRQMGGSFDGVTDSVGPSRASEAIAAHRRRGKTKKQSHMDAEFSTPSPPYSHGAPAASTESTPSSASGGNGKVLESLIHMQKVLNEQQELLRKQILEISNAAEAGSGGETASATAGKAPDQILSDDMMNDSSDDEGSTSSHSRASPGGIHDQEAALYAHELAMLEKELNKFSADAEPALTTARTRCPDITDNVTLRLLFLWCTDFDVAACAERMAGYWRLRVEIFGVEKAFLSLSSDSILTPEDRSLMLRGFIRILPNTDADGRTLIYINQQKLHSGSFDPMSAARVIWFSFNTILTNDPEKARRGIIGIANYRGSSWSPNYSWMTVMSKTLEFTPIEIKGIHLVHAGIFARIIVPLTSRVIGPWIRKTTFTLHAHEGQDAAVLSSLARFGIPNHCVPTELGGAVQ
jgi:hypothetical protein